jgi:predicted lipid carrier protein YhbT
MAFATDVIFDCAGRSGVDSIFAERERRVTGDLESGFLVAKSTKSAARYSGA